ncbi:MAG: hydrolase [Chromatiaceae bacterium]|nr:hydrolase [Gammaproteobacteria bacterium]MCP5300036.1 hydrolase [Chromatiaceae bacterium]MCP5422108.1 hydrolase [Chromatiaceae bacterium]
MFSNKFPCPCCGHRVFDHQPGFNQLCPICGWEDSLDQLRFPTMPGSANHVSLVEAQRNYANCGTAERRKQGQTREPFEGEPRDEQWRPVDISRDNIEEPQRGLKYADSYPYEDTTVLYYWRKTYWRRIVG